MAGEKPLDQKVIEDLLFIYGKGWQLESIELLRFRCAAWGIRAVFIAGGTRWKEMHVMVRHDNPEAPLCTVESYGQVVIKMADELREEAGDAV